MENSITHHEERNKAIIASYLLITKVAKQLLSSLEQDLLRAILEVDCKAYDCMKPKIHEFISPLCYTCLKESENNLKIHFGYDQSKEFEHITGKFIRMIYKLTMKDYTKVDIEDCISIQSIITDTSSLLDFMEWKHPTLQVQFLKYKPALALPSSVA